MKSNYARGSEEVVWGLSGHMRFSSPGSWVKLEEGVLQSVVKFHDSSLVSASVAVIWGGEDGDHVPVVRPVVPLHHQLVSSGHQGQTIAVVECLGDVLTKCVSSSSGRDSPATSVIRVRPEQVAHGTLVRNLLESVQGADVVQSVDAGRQSSMETEDLTVHQGSQRKIVKQIGEIFPNIGIAILPQTLVIKSIDLGDLSALMITTEDGDAAAKPHLESDEESDSLNTVVSSINIVSHEEIVGVWRLSPDPEQLHEVMELSMNISTHCHWTLDCLDIALLGQDLLGLLTQDFNLIFRQLLAFH